MHQHQLQAWSAIYSGNFWCGGKKGLPFLSLKEKSLFILAHKGWDNHRNPGACKQTCQGGSCSLPMQGRFVSRLDERNYKKGNKLATSFKKPFQTISREGQSRGPGALHQPRMQTLRCVLLQAGIKLPNTCTTPASSFFGSLGELESSKAPLPGSPPDPWQLH